MDDKDEDEATSRRRWVTIQCIWVCDWFVDANNKRSPSISTASHASSHASTFKRLSLLAMTITDIIHCQYCSAKPCFTSVSSQHAGITKDDVQTAVNGGGVYSNSVQKLNFKIIYYTYIYEYLREYCYYDGIYA